MMFKLFLCNILFHKIIEAVCSISNLQRKLEINYEKRKVNTAEFLYSAKKISLH